MFVTARHLWDRLPVLAAAVLPALLLLFMEAAPPPLAAQQSLAAPEGRPVSAADSSRTLRSARSGQSAFERLRRNNLDWTWSSHGGSCDEIVGRFCLWHGGDDSDWDPPPEPDEVTQGRAELIDALATAAAAIPGDAWVAGQRVRYLVEARRYEDAAAAARECRAAAWWCKALGGFALHTGRRWGAAEAAFDAALAEMPEDQRRDWTRLDVLLDRGWRDYRRGDAAKRDSLERRFWWLADPLYMVEGNDRRSEHFARLVMDELQDRAKTTEALSWGSDLRELLLRYGWPVGWERVRQPIHRMASVSIVSHYAPRSRSFLPRPELVSDPASIREAAWELDDESPRSEYAPAYTAAVEPLEHQLALLRDGSDSVTIVAAFQMPDSATASGKTVDGALIVAADERAAPRVARATGTLSRLSVKAAARPMLVSVEALVADSGQAGRARFGIQPQRVPRDVPAISDILLLSAADSLPHDRAGAIALARTSERMGVGEEVGLYWEIYNLSDAGEALDVSVTVEDAGRGWVRGLAERIGIARKTPPVRLRWQEAAPPGARTAARSLSIQLPDERTGEFLLRIRVDLPGREPLEAVRRVTVAP